MNRKGRNDPRWRYGEALEGSVRLKGQSYKTWLDSRRNPEPVRVIVRNGVELEPVRFTLVPCAPRLM